MEKNIKTNTIINIIRTISLSIISFITFPWVCRYLGETALGEYSWAVSFITYFTILAKVGIPNFAIKECVKVRDNKELLSNKVQTFFIIEVIASLISLGIMSIIVFSAKNVFTDPALMFILSINFMAGAFSFEWLFVALEKQMYMSVRSILCLALAAILIIVFIRTPEDMHKYATLTVLITFINCVINLCFVFKYISLKKTMPYDFKSCLKPLSVLLFVTLLITLYNQTDTFILGLIEPTKVEVSSYSIGVKGIDIVIGIIASLTTVFMPRAAESYHKNDIKEFNKVNKFAFSICAFIVLPAIATMTILSKPICGLISGRNYFYDYPDLYHNAPYVLMILAPIMLTYSLGDMIYAQILLPSNKEKHYLITLLCGFAVNVGLSLLFGLVIFKDNPSIGVAIGTAVVDLAVLIVLLIYSKQYSLKQLFNLNNLKILISSLVVAGVTLGIKALTDTLLFEKIKYPTLCTIQILSSIVIGGAIYVLILKLQKEDIINSYLSRKENTANE